VVESRIRDAFRLISLTPTPNEARWRDDAKNESRDVRLNALVGKEFVVGSIHLRGVELCEPCGTLARCLAATAQPKRALIRQFTHRAGLRADVVSSGRIVNGDLLTVMA
jgi:MOSC domain-containing protein YiiM